MPLSKDIDLLTAQHNYDLTALAKARRDYAAAFERSNLSYVPAIEAAGEILRCTKRLAKSAERLRRSLDRPTVRNRGAA